MSTETNSFRVLSANGVGAPQILCRITETMCAGLKEFSVGKLGPFHKGRLFALCEGTGAKISVILNSC